MPSQVDTEVHGLSADQVLTSEAFGLRSSRAPEFVAEMEKVAQRFQRRKDRESEEQFHRMIMHGAAAEDMPSRRPRDETPPEVLEAAQRLREVASQIEQDAGSAQPRTAGKKKARKKQAGSTDSAKKRVRSTSGKKPGKKTPAKKKAKKKDLPKKRPARRPRND
jgi:hypothetical protein